MDTDLIFKRGVAYMLATGLIIAGYVGTVALISVWVHNAMPEAVREQAWCWPSCLRRRYSIR